ncbi:MAG TPA: YidB family protein [Candidatus Udaeobacter sp.]|nr:YidB family protein [Candidatus Udaeobacter sp.]
MGLLDSILGAVSGKGDTSGKAAPLIGILSGLLTQCGGLQGLASKFSQSGQRDAFSSWVGLGENQSISSNQIQEALGSDQVRAIAARMGVDPAMASNFLAEYLPKIVDKLTPTGKIDPTADHQQGLAALLPALLQSLGEKSGGDQSPQA